MARLLSAKQKAAIADCSCPLPKGAKRQAFSKKAIIFPFSIFAGVLLVLWVVLPVGVLWLLGIYAALVICNFVYRLIRGHTLWCAVKWSPVAALYIIGEGIASATP